MNPSFFSSASHQQQTPGLSGFSIRVAASNDLTQLADILAMSFHSREGFVEWVYPVLRLGIYEDLKNRLRSKAEHYICLVAELVSRESGMQNYRSHQTQSIAGTIEMAL
ncbi:MAG: GNAT family N-acetyltransferase, partial [Oscillatoriales cyanobacterium]